MRELVVRSTGSETLSYARLRWAKDEGCDLYLPLRCEQLRQGGHVRLLYEIERCVSLRSYLRRTPVHAQIMESMLVGLARAVACCMRAGHSYSSLLFDDRHVFVDATAQLQFVFVPLDGMPYRADGSPLALLQRLSDTSALRFATPNDCAMAHLLRTFVMEQEGVFSLNRYHAFVAEQTGAPNHCAQDARAIPLRDGGSTDVLGDRESAGPCSRFLLLDLGGRRSFELAEGHVVSLGRDPGCDVWLEGHADVSRRHASICVRDGSVLVTDLGSTNGTFVNGRRIAAHESVLVSLGQSFSLSADSFCVRRTGKDVMR